MPSSFDSWRGWVHLQVGLGVHGDALRDEEGCSVHGVSYAREEGGGSSSTDTHSPSPCATWHLLISGGWSVLESPTGTSGGEDKKVRAAATNRMRSEVKTMTTMHRNPCSVTCLYSDMRCSNTIVTVVGNVLPCPTPPPGESLLRALGKWRDAATP